MAYTYFETSKGKAYYEEKDGKLSVVTDPTVYKKLSSGQISAEKREPFKATSSAPQFSGSLPSIKGTAEGTLPDTPKKHDMMAFSSALNRAIELGRAQRNDSALDYLGGAVKPGSVSASSFTGLLSNINSIFDKTTDKLYDAAISDAEAQNKLIADEKNNLNDLATKLIDQGVNGETIKSILATGSLEAALPAAAEALKGKVKDAQIYSTSDGIVAVTYDEEGNPVPKLIYKTSGGGSTGSFGKVSTEDLNDITTVLNTDRGADGYTDTATYELMYNQWLDQEYSASEFFSKFPPNIWVNPNDPSAKQFIKDQMKTDDTEQNDNPFANSQA